MKLLLRDVFSCVRVRLPTPTFKFLWWTKIARKERNPLNDDRVESYSPYLVCFPHIDPVWSTTRRAKTLENMLLAWSKETGHVFRRQSSSSVPEHLAFHIFFVGLGKYHLGRVVTQIPQQGNDVSSLRWHQITIFSQSTIDLAQNCIYRSSFWPRYMDQILLYTPRHNGVTTSSFGTWVGEFQLVKAH